MGNLSNSWMGLNDYQLPLPVGRAARAAHGGGRDAATPRAAGLAETPPATALRRRIVRGRIAAAPRRRRGSSAG